MDKKRKSGAPKANCHLCPLYDRPIVPSKYPNGEASLCVIGEAPGYQEAEDGMPFVGPSGQLLKLALEEADVNPDSVMYTNVVLCHPDRNSDPSPEAIEACRPRLMFELKQADAPILTTGKISSQTLLGADIKITSDRGQRVFDKELGHTITPTLHPAFLLRPGKPGMPSGATYYPDFYNDIKGSVKDSIVSQDVEYTVVDKESIMIGLVKSANQTDELVYDLETDGFTPYTGGILAMGVAISPNEVYVIPGDKMQEFRDHIKKLFSHGMWYGHHIKFDNSWMRRNDLPTPETFRDTLLMSLIIDERTGKRSLKVLCADLLGVADWSKPVSDYIKKNKLKSYSQLPEDMLYPYLALDVYNNWILAKELKIRLVDEREDWEDFYDRILAPVSKLAEDIHVRGMNIDVDLIDEIAEFTESRAMSILAEMRQDAKDPEFNPRSPMQVRKILFDERKMKPIKRSRGGSWSTDKEVLETLKRIYPDDIFLTNLMRYRQANKVLTSYTTPIRKSLRNGRAYVSHNVGGTETGRLTDRIPEGKRKGASWLTITKPGTNEFTGKLRKILIADPGYLLLYADYSQNELRVLACESGDEKLIDVFKSGRDVHSESADFFFPNWTDDAFRSLAKNINFEIIYGGGPKKTVDMGAEKGIVLTMRQAIDMHERWFENYPKIREYRQNVWNQVYELGYVETTFGRRRHFPLITHENWPEIQRQSFNTVIQAPANTLNMMAAIRLEYEMEAQVLLLQHDSIICQVPEELAEEKSIEMKEIMESTPGTLHPNYQRVPFIAEVGIAKNWLDAEKNSK